MSYFPLDRAILSSSVWATGTPEQFKLWVYLLLAASPRTGIVTESVPGIALRCGLTLDVTAAGLDWLAGPDPHSRTPDHGGRRIERLPEGGIRLLNYERHRDQDYSTPRVRALRQKRSETTKRRFTVPETTETKTKTETEVVSSKARAKNPMVDRARDEPLVLALVREIRDHPRLRAVKLWPSQPPDPDGTEIIRAASRWGEGSYVNPASMPDDRLAHAKAKLREWVELLNRGPTPTRERPWERAEREANESGGGGGTGRPGG